MTSRLISFAGKINSFSKTVLYGNNSNLGSLGRRYYYQPPTWEINDTSKLNNITRPIEEEMNKDYNQGIIWVNNLYPIKVSRLDFRSLLFHIPITKKLNSIFPEDIQIISIEKRIKEGGAYIHFQYKDPKIEKLLKIKEKEEKIKESDEDDDTETIKEIEHLKEEAKDIITSHGLDKEAAHAITESYPLSESDIIKNRELSLLRTSKRLQMLFEQSNKHFHFARKPARCMLVQGKPFVDDIDYKLPSYTLRITFKGAEMTVDDLYRQVRPYGHISDIYISSKDPKVAYVIFQRMEGAIATRNCLHQKFLQEHGTTLYIEYEQMLRINMIKEQFSKHPRIMIPLIGLLATLLTILLFNPLREYFINRRLSEPYVFDEIDEWQTRDEEKKLLSHFNYPPNSIVMLCAPKGSGKSSMIDKILQDRINTLLVDCSQDVNNSDEEFVENFSKAIGFFPSFGFYGNLSGIFDAIIPTGKSAFHSTTAYQIQTILKILDDCLTKKSMEFPLNPHEPYTYPLIVIDGLFGMIQAMENKEKANIIMDSIIQWAITSTQRGNSHVVFISSDPFGQDTLKKYLDNRGGGQINTIQLADVSPSSAKTYIKTKLDQSKTSISDGEMNQIVEILGGRYYDLNILSQRLVSGEPVNEALRSMIQKAVADIRGEGFGLSKRTEKGAKEQLKWTRPQLWETMKRVANLNFVSYDDLLFNVFLGDESSLNNLITSGLLRFQSIESERMVTGYSPLYCAAFKEMVNDVEFNVGMDILVQKARIEEEYSKLSKVEDELLKIKHLNSQTWFEPAAIGKRRKLLEEKMRDHVSKIEVRENILKSHQQFQKLSQQQAK
ncbi:hypothetical protein DLAC_00529 [Tieghemostelium lacteum]|uniref:Mitochondrial escape protein 2 C-terminal domain-containing protein n=1 Tax=Tieghemostelium lacteum TaxID=361077 RepID=A0A152A9Y9_TIELA|nr:hypothetical protein DLAC_00529 [Tieghemostelium lacteum]|eukprot:KYR03038.1 hypothetical protein DLAC_00529 [Tieghemostelium lacteum]